MKKNKPKAKSTAPTTRAPSEKPKELWAIAVNLNGPWSDKPVKVKYNSNLESYWDKNGDLHVPIEGYYDEEEGYLIQRDLNGITFEKADSESMFEYPNRILLSDMGLEDTNLLK